MKGYKDVQMITQEDGYIFDRFQQADVTPVAVELLPNSTNILDFEHPKNALYIFGPEDGSIPQMVRRFCHHFVFMPTHHCMNLAAAVNVLLFHRRMQRIERGEEEKYHLSEMLKEHRGPVWATEK
jgi:tRNA(Leu) C34 or U34 (ribose-2'-O)-methylase TrmL